MNKKQLPPFEPQRKTDVENPETWKPIGKLSEELARKLADKKETSK